VPRGPEDKGKGETDLSRQLRGLAITAASVLLAAVVSAVRLRPYLESEATWTPPHVITYPALAALGFAFVVYAVMRARHRGGEPVDLGPLKLSVRHLAVVAGCLAYVLFVVAIFP